MAGVASIGTQRRRIETGAEERRGRKPASALAVAYDAIEVRRNRGPVARCGAASTVASTVAASGDRGADAGGAAPGAPAALKRRGGRAPGSPPPPPAASGSPTAARAGRPSARRDPPPHGDRWSGGTAARSGPAQPPASACERSRPCQRPSMSANYVILRSSPRLARPIRRSRRQLRCSECGQPDTMLATGPRQHPC